jgi:hypothetical protein
MKLYEKLILLLIVLLNLYTTVFLRFGFLSIPYLGLLSSSLFLLLIINYAIQIQPKFFKIALFSYAVLTITQDVFYWQNWTGATFLNIINLLLLIGVSIKWILKINEENKIINNQRLSYISRLFLVFLISQYFFIGLSILIFIPLIFLIKKELSQNSKETSGFNLNMTKVISVYSLVVLIQSLPLMVISNFI